MEDITRVKFVKNFTNFSCAKIGGSLNIPPRRAEMLIFTAVQTVKMMLSPD
jgi:hypothetical protein